MAEGYAMLAELELTSALQNVPDALALTAAAAPIEAGFYRAMMDPDAELTPESAAVALVSVLIKRNRSDEAIEILTRILIDDPDNRKAIELASAAIDTEPNAGLGKILERPQSAFSANPGNYALAALVARTKDRVMN